MPSQDKKEKVKQIQKWFDKSESLLVLHYKGLSVAEANELRGTLSGMDCDIRVVKNTLTRIALADSPKEDVTPLIDGPVAVAFVNDEPAAVAKVLRDFGKGRQDFYLRGGLLEGRVLDGKQVEAYAALPTREVLLSQMVGVVQAPLSRLIGTVVAPARKMLGLFQALAATKEVATEKPAQPAAEVTAGRPSEEQSAEATVEEVATATEPQAATEPAEVAQAEEPSTEATVEEVANEVATNEEVASTDEPSAEEAAPREATAEQEATSADEDESKEDTASPEDA